MNQRLEVFDMWKKMVDSKLNSCTSVDDKEEVLDEIITELLDDQNSVNKYLDYMFDKVKEELEVF